MPTYDYECSKCGHRFEKFQKMTDAPVKSCPKCKGKADRLIGSGSGVIFKGTGFYQTDYKNKGKGADNACHGTPSDKCKDCPSHKHK
jgi:putative FmdB family regulatory protein